MIIFLSRFCLIVVTLISLSNIAFSQPEEQSSEQIFSVPFREEIVVDSSDNLHTIIYADFDINISNLNTKGLNYSIEDRKAFLQNISLDSFYVAENATWEIADSNNYPPYYGRNSKITYLDIIKFDKDVIMRFDISCIKTANDSIFPFNPPEYFAYYSMGKLSNGTISSFSNSLNGKNIKWLDPESFIFDGKVYILNKKLALEDFRNLLIENSFEADNDSFKIILSGP